MEVTKSNFYQLLPTIKEAIDKCDFITIDCELTGLHSTNNIVAFDSQKVYYEKVRKSSKDFLIIQYGLCLFRYDKNSQVYKQQGYNFYVFPRSSNRYAPDHRFLCQASSIDFLATCGFDFNKVFKEGIPYLNANEEDKYKKSLLEFQKIRANQIQNTPDKSMNVSMTIEEKSIVDTVFKEIQEFVVGDDEERILSKCNSYIRRLIYGKLHEKFLNKVSLETRILENKDRVLVATRFKVKSSKEEENRKTIDKEEGELQKCIGFSNIIRVIVESGKLVVGHNMFLDLLHTMNQFLTPLPFDYEEFKELAHYSFSRLLDTKHMSSIAPFKSFIDSNVLAHLLSTLQKEPFGIPNVEIEENMEGYTLDSNKAHEAGYDAYITGLCFLAMWKYLNDEPNGSTSHPDFSLLEPYHNRLFLMRLQDGPYTYLGGDDPKPSRDHIVYLSFPTSWKLNDIVQLFSPFGNIYVAWINDTSAYVALNRRDQISIALSTLSQSDTYTVMSYAQHQAELVRPSLPIPTATQKKRSASNIKTTVKKIKIGSGDSSVLNNKSRDLPLRNESLQEIATPKRTPTKKHVQNIFTESIDWE